MRLCEDGEYVRENLVGSTDITVGQSIHLDDLLKAMLNW